MVSPVVVIPSDIGFGVPDTRIEAKTPLRAEQDEIQPIYKQELDTREKIREYIHWSSEMMNVDPQLSLSLAFWESNFDPKAENPKSSAGGLFMFIDSTWENYCQSENYKPSKFDPKPNADCAIRMISDKDLLRRHWGADPKIRDLLIKNNYLQ